MMRRSPSQPPPSTARPDGALAAAPVFAAAFAALAFAPLAACDPLAAGSPETPSNDAPRTAFAWRAAAVPDLAPTWGGFVAERSDGAAIRVGGVDGDMVVSDQTRAMGADGVVAASPAIEPSRYCGCAMIDEARGELVVIGGRDGGFVDAPTAIVVDLTTGTRAQIDHGGAADFPVGCAAFFLPGLDRGYLFGGLSTTRGGFSATTWRWDPDARTFTALTGDGPGGRYDPAIKVVDETTAVMASGMGRSALGVRFFDDVWRFDGATESWTEVPTDDPPPGRRWPFFAMAPDRDTFVYGYGSDSARGETVLGDLWRLTLSTGAWAVIDVEDAPAPRGFASRLPGGVGLLAHGFDGLGLVDDAWILEPPDDLAGAWR